MSPGKGDDDSLLVSHWIPLPSLYRSGVSKRSAVRMRCHASHDGFNLRAIVDNHSYGGNDLFE